jgi:Uma2 family endonuclease
MPGVGAKHNLIAGQLYLLVRQHLRGKKCSWHTSAMRIFVARKGMYAYPDLSAACEAPQHDNDTLLNPSLIVEVISPPPKTTSEGSRRGCIGRCLP